MTYINIARCMGPVSTFWTRGFWACSSMTLPGLIACDQLQTIRGPGLSISRDDTSGFFRHVARSASRMSNDEFFHDKSDFPWFPSGSGGEGKNIQRHMLKKTTHVCFQVCWIWAPDVSKCFKFCQGATAQTSWRWPSRWVGRITASEHVENVMVQGCPLDTFQPKALRWRTLTNFVAPRPAIVAISCYSVAIVLPSCHEALLPMSTLPSRTWAIHCALLNGGSAVSRSRNVPSTDSDGSRSQMRAEPSLLPVRIWRSWIGSDRIPLDPVAPCCTLIKPNQTKSANITNKISWDSTVDDYEIHPFDWEAAWSLLYDVVWYSVEPMDKRNALPECSQYVLTCAHGAHNMSHSATVDTT